MNVLDLLSQDGIITKRVSSTNGGEHSSPCPCCGGTDRFRVWAGEGYGGRWWCRRCEKSGDAITYLMEFRGVKYTDACALLGKEPASERGTQIQNRHGDENSNPADKQSVHKTQKHKLIARPREASLPEEKWMKEAEDYVAWAQRNLLSNGKLLQWLAEKYGLNRETIESARLGWVTKDLFDSRSNWGLPEEMKDDGKGGQRPKKLCIPRGLLIPGFNSEGRLVRIRIRRPEGDPRYYVLPGSSMAPLVFGLDRRSFIVVESELDAILLFQIAADHVGVIATGSAYAKPDKATAEILAGAVTILVSLDSDDAGAKASWQWWLRAYEKAKRWPVIRGKDHSEAWSNGLDLRLWVIGGLLHASDQVPIPGDELLSPSGERSNFSHTGDRVEDKATDYVLIPETDQEFKARVDLDIDGLQPDAELSTRPGMDGTCCVCRYWRRSYPGSIQGVCHNMSAKVARFHVETSTCRCYKR